MSDFDWSRKSKEEKFLLYAFTVGALGFMGYGTLVAAAHRWITWNDLTWGLIFAILKSMGILAFFPLIALPVIFLVKKGRPHRPEHKFYREWASVFRRPSKGGGYIRFFVENVESFNLQRTFFETECIYVVTAQFKAWSLAFLGRPPDVRFILRVQTESDLGLFINWAQSNLVNVTMLPEEAIQVR